MGRLWVGTERTQVWWPSWTNKRRKNCNSLKGNLEDAQGELVGKRKYFLGRFLFGNLYLGFSENFHRLLAWKSRIHTSWSVRIRSYSGSYFPTFGLNTERYPLRIHSKCKKTQTKITPNTGTFYALPMMRKNSWARFLAYIMCSVNFKVRICEYLHVSCLTSKKTEVNNKKLTMTLKYLLRTFYSNHKISTLFWLKSYLMESLLIQRDKPVVNTAEILKPLLIVNFGGYHAQ